MAILGFELEEIARLLTLLAESGLEEIVIAEEGRYLRLRGPRPPKASRHTLPPDPPSAAPSPRSRPRPALAPKLPAEAAADPGQIVLTAPMVGTFFQAEKPGAPPLIAIGQTIAVGQTIGIIEAMKIFSEVPAEAGGVVVAIPAQDGQLVQNGAPLVILRKEA